MARFGAYLLLAVLAVFPLASLGRPTAVGDFKAADFKAVNFTGTLSEAFEWIAAEESRVRGDNADHIYFSIQSQYSPGEGRKLCIDVDLVNVVMKDCVAGQTSQLWYVDDTFIKHYNNWCLESCPKHGDACIHYNPPLNEAIRWPCHGGMNQQFKPDGNKLICLGNNDCLDVCMGGCSPKLDLITYPCSGSVNQLWTFLLGGYSDSTSELTAENPEA